MADLLSLRPAGECRWDLVALGEVMLRLDPGDERISTARTFRAWEGGGEYNVARGLRRCFGLRTTVVTAFADNPVGRLVEDFILQGGVDTSHIHWVPYDGVGRSVRNGLNFTERGFGVRGAVGCSDRGNTAVSQLRPGDVDWRRDLRSAKARAGSTPAASSRALRDDGRRRRGGDAGRARGRRRRLVRPQLPAVPVAGDRRRRAGRRGQPPPAPPRSTSCSATRRTSASALGYEIAGVDEAFSTLEAESYAAMMEAVVRDYPNLKMIATSLRTVKSATVNDWGGICYAGGQIYEADVRRDLEILDRVGGGDSFASGLIYGLQTGLDVAEALAYGVAHGALAMTTPGDTSMATLAEVTQLVGGGHARVQR